jgi:subtilase family serine protease
VRCEALEPRLLLSGDALIGLNIEGADSGWFPPDTFGAVGPDHVVMLINGQYSVHDKAGDALVSDSLEDFWRSAGLSNPRTAFDPRVAYDPAAERFYAAAVNRHSDDNEILFAVSRSADPLDGWDAVAIDSDSADQRWADFPQLGFDDERVIVSAYMLPQTGVSLGAQTSVLAFDKAALLQPEPGFEFGYVENVRAPAGDHVQPAVYADPFDGAPQLFSETAFFPDIDVIKRSQLEGPLEALTVGDLDDTQLTVGYDEPGDGDQPGSAADLEANDKRVSSTVSYVGGSYWGVQSVGLADGRIGARWWEIGGDGALRQDGLISDPALDLLFPSIAVNDAGDAVVGFTAAGPDQYASVAAAIGTTDAQGQTTFGPPLILHAGVDEYERTDSRGRNRWGDYSATVVDPADPTVFWTFQEYVEGHDDWATRIVQLVPRPANLAGMGLTGPGSLAAGQAADFQFQIDNLGVGAAAASTVRFYLSDDAQITPEDRLLDERPIDGLDAGATTGPLTQTLTLPSVGDPFWADDGTYHLGFIVDAADALLESDETDNRNRGAGLDTLALNVDVDPAADLVTESIVLSMTAAEPGTALEADLAVINFGGAAAGAFDLDLRLSRDPLITVDDPLLARRTISGLGAHSDLALHVPIVLPGHADPVWVGDGTYYLGAITDAGGAVAESDETNNANRGLGVDTAALGIDAGPDLVGTLFELPADVLVAGQQALVDFAVANVGSALAGAFDVELRLSPDATIDFSDPLLATRRLDGLSHGETTGPLAQAVTLPEAVHPVWDTGGPHYLGLRIDTGSEVAEVDEANNANRGDGLDRAPFTAETTLPDLVGEYFNVLSREADAGQSVTTIYELRNIGSGDLGPFDVAFYLSVDETVGPGDRLLGQTTLPGLPAGQRHSNLLIELDLPAPDDPFWPADEPVDYTIGLVLDPDDLVPEANEANNANLGRFTDQDRVAVRRLPDLALSRFAVEPLASFPGRTVAVDYTLANLGPTDAAGFTVSFRLSDDPVIDATDRPIGSVALAGLAADAEHAAAVDLVLPEATDPVWAGPGTYYLGAIVDDGDQVIEDDEANNANQGHGVDRDVLDVDFASFVAGRILYSDGLPGAGEAANPTGLPVADTQPLLPGQFADTGHVSTFRRGLNALAIDLAGLARPQNLGLNDLALRVGNVADVTAWPAAPEPAVVTLASGAGANGSDRLLLLWPDRQLADQWLQVTLLSTLNTGLVEPVQFYFGHLTGDGNGDFTVDPADLTAAAAAPHDAIEPAGLDDPHDHDRDGRVNVRDILIARAHLGRQLHPLDLTGFTEPLLPAADTPVAQTRDAAQDGGTIDQTDAQPVIATMEDRAATVDLLAWAARANRRSIAAAPTPSSPTRPPLLPNADADDPLASLLDAPPRS